IVDSAVLYQRAEVQLRRNDLKGARALVEQALQLKPDESDYIALLAWLKFQSVTPTRPPADALKDARQALSLNEANERAHYYLAMMLKANQEEAEALKHFQRVVELNPRHIEAQREIRLAKMRKRQIPTTDSNVPFAGLIDKLFKKPNDKR